MYLSYSFHLLSHLEDLLMPRDYFATQESSNALQVEAFLSPYPLKKSNGISKYSIKHSDLEQRKQL